MLFSLAAKGESGSSLGAAFLHPSTCIPRYSPSLPFEKILAVCTVTRSVLLHISFRTESKESRGGEERKQYEAGETKRERRGVKAELY